MKSILLTDATDLTLWANRRDAQATLPQLIRRLVHATAKHVLRAGFRSGEGVQLGGWDGLVVAEEGGAFVPDGMSVWEMGVTRDVKGKADEDYEKRSKNPEGVIPADSAFVFVTPRRWAAKDEWVASRQAEGAWREVRAYDADDLEEWLELAPAVHVWLSTRLGKKPEGADDLETYWEDWSATTEPRTPPEFVLAGRDEVEKKVHEWLRGTTPTLALRAESRDEALAIFAAAIGRLPSEEAAEHLSRAVLVRDSGAMNSLVMSEEPLILIPVLDSPEAVTKATRSGHRVVLTLGPSDAEAADAVKVPRVSRGDATKVLMSLGIGEDRARARVRRATQPHVLPQKAGRAARSAAPSLGQARRGGLFNTGRAGGRLGGGDGG